MSNTVFPLPLDLRFRDDGRFELRRPFLAFVEAGGRCYRCSLPRGFVTDFASIPRLLWPLLPPIDPRWAKAAVVHDYLYQRRGRALDVWLDRGTCDLVLREAAAALGAGWFARWAIYLGVRLGGWVFFGR